LQFYRSLFSENKALRRLIKFESFRRLSFDRLQAPPVVAVSFILRFSAQLFPYATARANEA
jgi:hypothetical protein